jgi:hypothetical protein
VAARVLFEKWKCSVAVVEIQFVVAAAAAVVAVSFFVEILEEFLEDMSDHYVEVYYASDSGKMTTYQLRNGTDKQAFLLPSNERSYLILVAILCQFLFF